MSPTILIWALGIPVGLLVVVGVMVLMVGLFIGGCDEQN